MVSLAQEVGGPEVSVEWLEDVLKLRKALEGLDTLSYAPNPNEFALILRVDASLKTYGPEMVENPILRKSYIQVDIVVAENRWKQDAAGRRSYLARVIGKALELIFVRLEREKRLIRSKKEFLENYENIARRFLES